MKRYLAIDIGNSSGRGMIAHLADGKITLQEIYRFTHELPQVNGRLHTDILYLFSQVKQAILACKREGITPDGIGIDTWGVDFGLVDEAGELVANPYNCRDPKGADWMDAAYSIMPKEEIFRRTGIAFQPFNTLFQLMAMQKIRPWVLKATAKCLTLPDLLGYMLTGNMQTDYTNASTFQLMDARTRLWDEELLGAFDIPASIFQDPVMPPAYLGALQPQICEELRIAPIPVYTVAGHDTASAIAAIPEEGDDYAYISSGTWSLMGIESPEPITTPEMLAANFSNEGGVSARYRILRNIMGLWILQECRKQWNREGANLSFDDLAKASVTSPAFASLIDVDEPGFLLPGRMVEKVQDFCRKTDQKVPETYGEVTRCIQESLALKYRWAMEVLDGIRGRRIARLHIVGGGSQDELLNRFACNAIGRPVVTGPVEATALGNAMLQAMASGEIHTLAEGRALIGRSFPVKAYAPKDTDVWDAAFERYLPLLGQTFSR